MASLINFSTLLFFIMVTHNAMAMKKTPNSYPLPINDNVETPAVNTGTLMRMKLEENAIPPVGAAGKKLSSAQLMELSDSATLKYDQMDQAKKNQIKAAYGLPPTGAPQSSGKKLSSAQLMELSDSATLKYNEMDQEKKNQIKAAYGLPLTGAPQSSGKKLSSAQLMELSDSATLKYNEMDQEKKNQIKAAYGLPPTGTPQSSGKSSGKKLSSAQLMELSASATLKYNEMDQENKNQIKAAYGLPPTGVETTGKLPPKVPRKISSKQMLEASGSKVQEAAPKQKVSSAELLRRFSINETNQDAGTSNATQQVDKPQLDKNTKEPAKLDLIFRPDTFVKRPHIFLFLNGLFDFQLDFNNQKKFFEHTPLDLLTMFTKIARQRFISKITSGPFSSNKLDKFLIDQFNKLDRAFTNQSTKAGLAAWSILQIATDLLGNRSTWGQSNYCVKCKKEEREMLATVTNHGEIEIPTIIRKMAHLQAEIQKIIRSNDKDVSKWISDNQTSLKANSVSLKEIIITSCAC